MPMGVLTIMGDTGTFYNLDAILKLSLYMK
jgi:hypothetical protein